MRGIFTGLTALTLVMTVAGAALADEGGDIEKGKKIFARCKACHTVEEEHASSAFRRLTAKEISP